MNVKELKDIIAGIPDNTKIIISNPQWKRCDIIGHQFCENSIADDEMPVLFIDIKNPKR